MRFPKYVIVSLAASIFAASGLAGCATAPKTEQGKENLHESVENTLKRLYTQDPTLEAFVKESRGYALFPTVGKGGLIVGGAYGKGEVYDQGAFIGNTDISQATVGLQAGGQSFAELIIFANEPALERFKEGKFAFAANASAVALKSGVGKSLKYTDGVAVILEPQGGLMAEAAIGGQSFSFQPK